MKRLRIYRDIDAYVVSLEGEGCLFLDRFQALDLVSRLQYLLNEGAAEAGFQAQGADGILFGGVVQRVGQQDDGE